MSVIERYTCIELSFRPVSAVGLVFGKLCLWCVVRTHNILTCRIQLVAIDNGFTTEDTSQIIIGKSSSLYVIFAEERISTSCS